MVVIPNNAGGVTSAGITLNCLTAISMPWRTTQAKASDVTRSVPDTENFNLHLQYNLGGFLGNNFDQTTSLK